MSISNCRLTDLGFSSKKQAISKHRLAERRPKTVQKWLKSHSKRSEKASWKKLADRVVYENGGTK
jgi:hypothetical protein